MQSAYLLNFASRAGRSKPAPVFSLQRKCDCGAKTSSTSGICDECEKKRLQTKLAIGASNDASEQEADQVARAILQTPPSTATLGAPAITPIVRRADAQGVGSAGVAPPIVHSVLSTPGTALDPTARSFFEPRFGHHFGDVRVHADAKAAESARAVGARAYAVGNHLVFGDAEYSFNTAPGRQILAHELTHVVQQGSALKRSSITVQVAEKSTGQPAGKEEEDPQRPAQKMQTLQRTPAFVGLDEAGPKADFTGKEETAMWNLSQREAEQKKKLDECLKAKGPDPLECKPAGALGWPDFAGTPVAASIFGAVTASDISTVDVPSNQCAMSATGYASGPQKRYQAVFDPTKSWVKAKSRDAADPAKNGSAAAITKCENHFDNAAAKNWINVTYSMSSAPDATCPASVRASGAQATTKAECTTVVGADFNTQAAAESARLLNHEQMHFNLTCALAKKANALLAGGADFSKIDAVIHTRLSTAQHQYDGEAHHGCNASGQAKWQAAIAAGLPDVKLP